jgi:hypothetical protein
MCALAAGTSASLTVPFFTSADSAFSSIVQLVVLCLQPNHRRSCPQHRVHSEHTARYSLYLCQGFERPANKQTNSKQTRSPTSVVGVWGGRSWCPRPRCCLPHAHSPLEFCPGQNQPPAAVILQSAAYQSPYSGPCSLRSPQLFQGSNIPVALPPFYMLHTSKARSSWQY